MFSLFTDGNKLTKVMFAKCKQCNSLIACSGWSTTCLVRHYNTHKILLKSECLIFYKRSS